MRFVLPIRTSKRKEEAKSPQQQRDLADSWAQVYRHEIVTVLDSGKSESGKTMDRETIRRAMQMVIDGEADGIVFALTDRLGRAPIEESMAWIRQLNLVGHLALADAGGEPINLSEPNAETGLVLQLQMARQYWLATARRFRQSQRDAVKAGKYIGKTPLGFIRVKGRLRECPVKGPIIREAFQLAASDGLHAAMAYLEVMLPAHKWTTSWTRLLLSNRAYLGEYHFHLKGDPVNGFEDEHLTSPHRHDALTDEDTFERAQTEPGERRPNGEYPLSGFMVCGRCGADMIGGLKTTPGYMRDPDNWRRLIVDPSKPKRSYRRMVCGAGCKGGCSISADQSEVYVRDELAAGLLSRPQWRKQFASDGLREAQAAHNAAQAERRALTKKVKPSHPDFSAWLAEAEAEVERTGTLLRVASRKASQAESLPLPHELTDPEQFERALRAATSVGKIVVAPGRGVVEHRISYEPFVRDDDEAGVLAA